MRRGLAAPRFGQLTLSPLERFVAAMNFGHQVRVVGSNLCQPVETPACLGKLPLEHIDSILGQAHVAFDAANGHFQLILQILGDLGLGLFGRQHLRMQFGHCAGQLRSVELGIDQPVHQSFQGGL